MVNYYSNDRNIFIKKQLVATTHNMKLLITISLTVVIITVGINCKKFLQQEPYNRIAQADIFKDLEGTKTVLAGCYNNLRSTNYYMRDIMVYADIVGGNLKYSRISNQLLWQTYNINNDAVNNELRSFYEEAYNTIYRCNTILENINVLSDANTFQKNRLLADTRTIRALVHFDLVKVFAQAYNSTPNASHTGIVIKTGNTPASTPPAAPSTVAQVYNFINAELDTVQLLYPNSVQIFTTGTAKGFLSADAAKALQCRVALYQGNWSRVITLANSLITPTYPLLTNINYINAWRGKNILTESIWELDFGNRIAGSLGDFYNPLSTSCQLAATADILNLYDAADVRSRNNLYSSNVVNGTTFFYTKKYNGIRDSANNIRLLRISEVYLSRAEANAQLNNLSPALADLNIIKKRAWPAAPTFSAATQAAVLTEVLQERRRELSYEGHYLYDLTRNGQGINRTDCQASINCVVPFPSTLLAIPLPNN